MQFDGLLLVDKPKDVTSHDVVAYARKALGFKTIGHTGTLDPLATGLMVLVLGEATKLSDYMVSIHKSYRVRVKFGLTTDSLDVTGKILSEMPCDLDPELIRDTALKLTGQFQWPVPVFSATKIGGKKLYEYGREGVAIEAPTKTMEFWDVSVLEVGTSHLVGELFCSKGSFVRSWASQLGEDLQVGGVMEELRRLSVGGFRIDQAIKMAELDGKATSTQAFIPMEHALPGIKSVMAQVKEARLMLNGQIPKDMAARLVPEQKQAIESQETVYIKVLNEDGKLLAILSAEAGQGLKIRRVFRIT